MKHPVLARMLAVMFAIVCLILLLVGVSDRGEAESAYSEAQRTHNKLLERIETYRSLEAALEGETPYAEANAEYVRRKAQYDRDVSRHKSDVSTHTTTQGSYEMGAEMMWEYRAQLVDAQYSLESMLSQAQLQYGSLTESEAMAAQCRAMAELCRGAAGLVGETPEISEPVPPTPPTMPEAPSFTTAQPQRGDYPEGAEGDAAYVQAAQNWLSEYSAYEQALMDYPAKLEAYYAALESYELEMAAYLEAYARYQQYQAIASQWQSVRKSAEDYLISIGMTPPQGSDAEALNAMADMFEALAQNSDAAAAAVTASLAALELEIAAASELVASLDSQLQSSLETLWYDMDNLDGETEELTVEKDYLLEEAEALKVERTRLDKLKENENRFRSTRILLLEQEEIKLRHEAGEELSAAAESYAAEFAVAADKARQATLLRCLLSVCSGIIGLVCVPAGFEKLKSRFFILVPTLLSMLCAAAAIYINHMLALDTYYAAMPVCVFGLLYLAFAMPRHKVVIRREI